MIVFEHVQHRYAASTVLDDVSFEVAEGELLAVIGASGAGKTTLLKLVNRLLEPTRGRVSVGGEDVARRDPIALRRSIGYVFQRFGLFPHLTLAENVAVGPKLMGWRAADVAARCDELLALLGLPPEAYRERLPRELSGGQQQRVGLARALAARPRIMLMDEPFGSLDPATRDQLQRSYRRLHDELGLTTLMVTHDVVEALLLADRVLVLHEGNVARLDRPRALMREPQPEAVARLLEVPRHQLERLEALGR
ncbi:MAG TPA: ATP-binding cassette domain-containing protein [Polyangiaceae bacterium]|nr:ATP-binding cassette domain-containing protein [Polyangiaceae bacterium]